MAEETALNFVGKGYSKVVDKYGNITYISKNGDFMARIGWKQGNQRYELNLEKWDGGQAQTNYHIAIE